VHVQCADPICDPLAETRFVAGQVERAAIRAIVGRASLTDPAFEVVLSGHLEASSLVRGIRDMAAADRLDDPAVERALAALARNGLSWDVQCSAAQMPAVVRLARRLPDLQLVLAHAGLAVARSAADLAGWRASITALAGAPNVACKLSGFGIGDHRWSVESWRPWVLTALEAFGAERCLFGSNWPVDRLFSSYQAVVDAQLEILAGTSETERDAIFAGTATRVYGL
jgi:predicted TIM-barrel fold metal-dependent hydrolase